MKILHSVGLGVLVSCLSAPAWAAVDTIEEDSSSEDEGTADEQAERDATEGTAEESESGEPRHAETETNEQDDGDGAAIADTKSAGILIEPLLAIFGFLEGEADITIDDSIAVGIWGQYFDYTLGGVGIGGYGIGVGAPIFLTGKTYSGMYVHPLFKFQQVKFTATDTEGVIESVTATYYGPLVTLGYQWSWGAFSLKLGGGLEYSLGKLNSSSIDRELSFEGLDFELDALIGVVF